MLRLLTTPLQVGQALTSRRKALKLSQATAAQRLGISQPRFSELELHPDRMTLDRLLVLANMLNLELVLREKDSSSAPKSEW
ncbi:MAG: XRE family transcriptional regulator [Azoarcus sp.]|nr:XRE family transcriptional regulator [Azoarcus sp.]